jgi:hypothetical protein
MEILEKNYRNQRSIQKSFISRLKVERRDSVAIFNGKTAKDEQEMCCNGHHQVGEQDGQKEQREERGT